MFVVDSFFTKGSTHAVCQDYTTHGVVNGKSPYVILADGCSTAPKAEFGAQLLVRSAELAVFAFIDYITSITELPCDKTLTTYFEQLVTRKLDAIANTLELDTKTLSATLLVAFVVERRLYTYVRGDGVISIKTTQMDGGQVQTTSMIHRLNYSTNAPYYLVYDINPIAKMNYDRMYGHGILTDNQYIYENGKFIDCVTHNEPIDKPVVMIRDIEPGMTLDHVVLCSDGVESYKPAKIHTDVQSADSQTAFERIMSRATAFKQIASGGFVIRRLGMMEIEDKKNMIEHTDDVSIAAICEVADVVKP